MTTYSSSSAGSSSWPPGPGAGPGAGAGAGPGGGAGGAGGAGPETGADPDAWDGYAAPASGHRATSTGATGARRPGRPAPHAAPAQPPVSWRERLQQHRTSLLITALVVVIAG